ncbi:CAP domain-containing protein [Paenibacillus pasadenensis]|uniref:CAP domain-containing protein n=1 Tax=Paenibacillus pasadenensis TaxID=217090 RepID=UPI00204067C2|nr:CAP domain-containing protein [Paenibacillus pasadenensis]MCM3749446.1 CAP domain-containing protein [Paenibacillus pasadenensis]
MTKLTIDSLPKRFATPIRLAAALLLGASLLGGGVTPHAEAAAARFADVPAKHWAASDIAWAASAGIAQGDGNGRFRPSGALSEPEFLAFAARAYGVAPAAGAAPGAAWHAPYYTAAAAQSWAAFHAAQPSARYTRGEAAQLLASVAGRSGGEKDAVAWLLAEGIASGRTASTAAGYESGSTLTRAEAAALLRRMLKAYPATGGTPSATPAPTVTPAPSATPAPTPDSAGAGPELRGVQLGDSEASLLQTLGAPDRKDPTQDGFIWYIYNKDYSRYMQAGVGGGKVVALYSGSPEAFGEGGGLWKSLLPGMSAASLKEQTGQQIPASDERFSFTSGGIKTTLFLDALDGGKLDALFVQTNSPSASAPSAEQLARASERQVFDLTNALRAKKGLPALAWDDTAAVSARKHSADMDKRDFFDHTNPDNIDPFDRMQAEGIRYSAAGENIAYGYRTAIEAHNGWLNSSGHRKAMLHERFTRLGVGVHNNYYTQNFYSPL